jgi:sirohydrochlorin ferrochelatase
MNAVILFSHGSLLCGAGEALQAHAERLRTQGIAPIVRIGYLNYSQPLFIETVAQCVKEGATRIFVLPYFLVPGYFVKVDLPKAVAEAERKFPSVQFRIADAIGYDERLADALIASAQTARTSEHWREDLRKAAQHCRANPECPLYGTPDCPEQPISP